MTKHWLFSLPFVLAIGSTGALAHEHPELDESLIGSLERPAPSESLAHHDLATQGMVVSDGPSAFVIKNLAEAGRGERTLPNATTDVWAHGSMPTSAPSTRPAATAQARTAPACGATTS